MSFERLLSQVPVFCPRILVVDDVKDNRDVLSRRLQRKSFQTVEAKNGREALYLLEQSIFDMVLLDVLMPGLDGLRVLRVIRRTPGLNNMPVIMVTANALTENIAEARALGANDYLTKPIDFTLALACIEMHLKFARTASLIDDARASLLLARTKAPETA